MNKIFNARIFSYTHQTINHIIHKIKICSCNYVMRDQQKSSRFHLNLKEKRVITSWWKNESIKQLTDVKIGLNLSLMASTNFFLQPETIDYEGNFVYFEILPWALSKYIEILWTQIDSRAPNWWPILIKFKILYDY